MVVVSEVVVVTAVVTGSSVILAISITFSVSVMTGAVSAAVVTAGKAGSSVINDTNCSPSFSLPVNGTVYSRHIHAVASL